MALIEDVETIDDIKYLLNIRLREHLYKLTRGILFNSWEYCCLVWDNNRREYDIVKDYDAFNNNGVLLVKRGRYTDINKLYKEKINKQGVLYDF